MYAKARQIIDFVALGDVAIFGLGRPQRVPEIIKMRSPDAYTARKCFSGSPCH
jgi:hypothetical protein